MKISCRALLVACACLAIIAGGCGDDTDGTPGDLAVRGSLSARSGAAVPGQSKLFVVWSVTAGSPDYAYKFGEVAVAGSAFELSLGDPPSEALNADHLGVGHLVLVASSFSMPEGKSDANAVEDNLIGLAEEYVLIYRSATLPAQPFREWIKDFPVGLSCGKVGPKQGSFVSFEPVDCNSLQIIVAPDVKFPNWT